jgi:methylated-DNA-protein-cysteine methyltransferase related protein
MTESESKYGSIYALVRSIPFGRVSTYGDVAVLAGIPGHARLVGYALHALPSHTTLPWHRVVNAHGAISLGRTTPGGDLLQRRLLEREGIEFDGNGRIPLQRLRWRPAEMDTSAG